MKGNFTSGKAQLRTDLGTIKLADAFLKLFQYSHLRTVAVHLAPDRSRRIEWYLQEHYQIHSYHRLCHDISYTQTIDITIIFHVSILFILPYISHHSHPPSQYLNIPFHYNLLPSNTLSTISLKNHPQVNTSGYHATITTSTTQLFSREPCASAINSRR